MHSGLPRPLQPLAADPGRSGVFSDFDGTLSPIVERPEAARPAPGAIEALGALEAAFARVVIVSGRPVAFLEPLMPAGVLLSGLYGLEESLHGEHREVPGLAAWRGVVEAAARRAESEGPAGMDVERKGLSLTLHFRARPDREGAVRVWAAEEADRSGLEVRSAKQSVELHPPVATDKGTAIEGLAAGLAAVCYLADDVGDLPGYDGLDRLAATGVHAARIAVRGPETPADVLDRADVIVDGPDGAVALLQDLVAAST